MKRMRRKLHNKEDYRLFSSRSKSDQMKEAKALNLLHVELQLGSYDAGTDSGITYLVSAVITGTIA